jgi:DNA-binding NarL/FixJ family response regulator
MIHKRQQEKKRVLVVDDHPIVRQGLSMLINRCDDLMVCGSAQDSSTAMEAVRTLKPDMAVVDISLKDSNGIELMKDIKAFDPALPILTLSMHEESLYAERALRAGAKGYIMKQEGTEKLISAIRIVLKGQIYISDKLAGKIINKMVSGAAETTASPIESLSDRELEVFLLIGKGQRTREISNQLHLSPKTVETYRSHIKEKLSLDSSAELLQHAIQWVSSSERV